MISRNPQRRTLIPSSERGASLSHRSHPTLPRQAPACISLGCSDTRYPTPVSLARSRNGPRSPTVLLTARAVSQQWRRYVHTRKRRAYAMHSHGKCPRAPCYPAMHPRTLRSPLLGSSSDLPSSLVPTSLQSRAANARSSGDALLRDVVHTLDAAVSGDGRSTAAGRRVPMMPPTSSSTSLPSAAPRPPQPALASSTHGSNAVLTASALNSMGPEEREQLLEAHKRRMAELDRESVGVARARFAIPVRPPRPLRPPLATLYITPTHPRPRRTPPPPPPPPPSPPPQASARSWTRAPPMWSAQPRASSGTGTGWPASSSRK
jgi:hypothetical protein